VGTRALPLVLVAVTALTGCGEVIEANIKAVETLGRDNATEAERTGAGLVIGGTVVVLTGLAVAGTVAAATVGSPADPPPEVVIVDELGWGFVRDEGGKASWRRCTSRLMCTHEVVSADGSDVLDVSPAGRGRPMALGGAVGDEVDLFAVRYRRSR
jgi:hypothetical protein